jgi:hypothetical protein
MDERNRDRPLAHCRRHPLDVAGTDVADREHPWQAGLEQVRIAPERPVGGGEVVRRQRRSGLDEAFFVERPIRIVLFGGISSGIRVGKGVGAGGGSWAIVT